MSACLLCCVHFFQHTECPYSQRFHLLISREVSFLTYLTTFLILFCRLRWLVSVLQTDCLLYILISLSLFSAFTDYFMCSLHSTNFIFNHCLSCSLLFLNNLLDLSWCSLECQPVFLALKCSRCVHSAILLSHFKALVLQNYSIIKRFCTLKLSQAIFFI